MWSTPKEWSKLAFNNAKERSHKVTRKMLSTKDCNESILHLIHKNKRKTPILLWVTTELLIWKLWSSKGTTKIDMKSVYRNNIGGKSIKSRNTKFQRTSSKVTNQINGLSNNKLNKSYSRNIKAKDRNAQSQNYQKASDMCFEQG